MEEETVRVHHDTLFLGYVTRLNAALANYPKYQSWSLEKLIRDHCELSNAIQTTVFNNAGGVYNHTASFAAMTPSYQTPSSFIASLINRSFGSYENFKTQMLANWYRCVGLWMGMASTRSSRVAADCNDEKSINTTSLVPVSPSCARCMGTYLFPSAFECKE